jgi:hypothetical protein
VNAGMPRAADPPLEAKVLKQRLFQHSARLKEQRRNTHSKSYLQTFQWLNSFASTHSKKTLPCLGFIECSPKDQASLKNTIGSTD